MGLRRSLFKRAPWKKYATERWGRIRPVKLLRAKLFQQGFQEEKKEIYN